MYRTAPICPIKHKFGSYSEYKYVDEARPWAACCVRIYRRSIEYAFIISLHSRNVDKGR